MKIKTPTLIINQQKVEKNIVRMLKKADRDNVLFRPHFKTHQSAEIGELFKQKGIRSITVSSVSMAKYFANNGWNDITIAFPVNILEADEINDLASKIKLNILLESKFSMLILSNKITQTLGVYLKIDTGYHRTGLIPEDPEIDNIIQILSKHKQLVFKGFLSHAGHTYSAIGKKEILRIMHESQTILLEIKTKIYSAVS